MDASAHDLNLATSTWGGVFIGVDCLLIVGVRETLGSRRGGFGRETGWLTDGLLETGWVLALTLEFVRG